MLLELLRILLEGEFDIVSLLPTSKGGDELIRFVVIECY